MVRLKYFCGAPIQNGGPKRKWISTQKSIFKEFVFNLSENRVKPTFYFGEIRI